MTRTQSVYLCIRTDVRIIVCVCVAREWDVWTRAFVLYFKCSVGIYCCCVDRDSGTSAGMKHSQINKRLLTAVVLFREPWPWSHSALYYLVRTLSGLWSEIYTVLPELLIVLQRKIVSIHQSSGVNGSNVCWRKEKKDRHGLSRSSSSLVLVVIFSWRGAGC